MVGDAAPLRVIKLGGSLLAWPGLKEAFRQWRATLPPARDLLLIGGGGAADWVRDIDRVHTLGDDAAHRLAIQSMLLNAEIAAQLWPEARWCSELREVQATHGPALLLLSPWPALSDDEQRRYGSPLPHSWEVTSDSIAAWLAVALHADELVLLKSTWPENDDLPAAAESGYVDRHFIKASQGVPNIRAVNLRDERISSRPLVHRVDAADKK
jgi:aspartokinase-like uncharacterized kinase